MKWVCQFLRHTSDRSEFRGPPFELRCSRCREWYEETTR